MKNILFITVCSILFYSCSGYKVKEIRQSTITDTLEITKPFLTRKGGKELVGNYYTKFGIVIPEHYIVKDSLAIDINRDSLVDTIVLFSPIWLEDPQYKGTLKLDPLKRVLVEVLNTGKGSKIRNSYYHLISHIPGVLAKYAGMYPTKSGFEIQHQSGSRYSWTYTTELSTGYQDSLFLVKSEKICSFEGNDSKKVLLFDKKSVKEINIQDTINKNCNCDSIWKYMEKTIEE